MEEKKNHEILFGSNACPSPIAQVAKLSPERNTEEISKLEAANGQEESSG